MAASVSAARADQNSLGFRRDPVCCRFCCPVACIVMLPRFKWVERRERARYQRRDHGPYQPGINQV
jgi:hypothetical protein